MIASEILTAAFRIHITPLPTKILKLHRFMVALPSAPVILSAQLNMPQRQITDWGGVRFGWVVNGKLRAASRPIMHWSHILWFRRPFLGLVSDFVKTNIDDIRS